MRDFLYFYKVPLLFIIGSILFTVSTIILLSPKRNLSVSITPEQELEARRRVEKNEAWLDGYKNGQIDAINGHIVFKLQKNNLGEIVWVHK
jgi:hypothetical protein